MKSIDDINPWDYPNGTIVILSQQDSGVPGYAHTKYAYIDMECPGRADPVDYYGPPVNPKDPELIQFEQRMCKYSYFEEMEGE